MVLIADTFIGNFLFYLITTQWQDNTKQVPYFSNSDEALAVSLLKRTNEFQGANLVRTRDATKLAECDIVVDVGGVYDPATHRYDHHQVSEKKKSYSLLVKFLLNSYFISVDSRRLSTISMKPS